MPNPAFIVFRAGKGTFTRTLNENGKMVSRIDNRGSGVEVGSPFSMKSEAVAFARNQLTINPGGVFYILDGELIVDSILDQEWHKAEERGWRRKFALVSTSVILALAAYFCPFHSPLGITAFALTFAAIYGLLLWMFGTGNIEAMVVVLIMLAVTVVAVSAYRKGQQRRHPTTLHPSHLAPPTGLSST